MIGVKVTPISGQNDQPSSGQPNSFKIGASVPVI